jgi:hypothetical protein
MKIHNKYVPSANTLGIEGPSDGTEGDRLAGGQEELGVILLDTLTTTGEEEGDNSKEDDGCDGQSVCD